MAEPADPRIIKLVRELSETKKKLTGAERRASIFKTLLHKEKQRTADAKPQAPADQR